MLQRRFAQEFSEGILMSETDSGRSSPDEASNEELLCRTIAQPNEHALLLLNADGRIVGWEMGAESLFGYTAVEMIGQSVSILFTPEDRALGMPEYELRTARENARAEDDRWHVRKDGTRVWISGITASLRDEHGRHIGYSKISRDRTDVKAQVEALESRVAALNETAERRTVFMGTVAHELDNTFVALRTALQLVRAKIAADADLAHLLEVGDHQLQVTRRLLDDLKDVTRIGSGKLQLQKAQVILNTILERAVETCRPAAEERRQTLDLLLPSSVIVLDADATRLHQVFVNLINNASKYTPEEGQIWVKMATEGEDVTVKVEDTGFGIGPELLPRLFHLFTRDEQSQTEGGLGIGLWLVKNLVDLHGGTVAVRSDGKDKGTEFSVRFQFRQAIPVESN